MVRIGETHSRGDFLHRIGSPNKVRRSLIHFQAGEHLVGAFPDKTIEEAREIGRVKVGQPGQFRDGVDAAEMLLQLSPASLKTLPGAALGLRRCMGIFLNAQRKQFEQQTTKTWRQDTAFEAGLQDLFVEIVDGLSVVEIGNAKSPEDLPPDNSLSFAPGKIDEILDQRIVRAGANGVGGKRLVGENRARHELVFDAVYGEPTVALRYIFQAVKAKIRPVDSVIWSATFPPPADHRKVAFDRRSEVQEKVTIILNLPGDEGRVRRPIEKWFAHGDDIKDATPRWKRSRISIKGSQAAIVGNRKFSMLTMYLK